jgi:uncharacterized protein DUF4242
MPRYLVERIFADAWSVGPDGCRRIVEQNADGVTWLQSLVSDDGRKTYCVYEAPSPEAIRKSAARNGLPVDSITSIRVLDPYSYSQEETCANSCSLLP